MPKHSLQIEGLTKQFNSNGAGPIIAIEDFSIEALPGEFVIVVGPNGSGKSTVLNLIAGDFFPDRGTIILKYENKEIDITSLPRWKRAKRIGRVYQDPKLGTIGDLTVLDNLRLVFSEKNCPSPFNLHLSKKKIDELLASLNKLHFVDKLNRKVSELSQGQRQVFAVLLALVRTPDILLLDEHTASLDHKNATECLKITEALCLQTQTTVIMVTHNMADAIKYGNRLIVLREGRVVANLAQTQKKELNVPKLFDLCGYSTPHIDS